MAEVRIHFEQRELFIFLCKSFDFLTVFLMSVDFLAVCACVFWVVFASISKQSHLSKQTFDKILVDEDFYFSPPEH